MEFTTPSPSVVKLICMGRGIKAAAKAAAPARTLKPTKMGERILLLMAESRLTNHSQFSENVLGISRQRFHAWLYKPLRDVEARPLLRCAEVLGTNPDYLLGDSDDRRPAKALDLREHKLVEAYRVLSETDQQRLLQTAAAWIGEISGGLESASFRVRAAALEAAAAAKAAK